MPRPAFFNYINRYALVPMASDPKDILVKMQKQYDATGTHFVGVVYVDHSAGVSMTIEIFCEVLPDGSLRETGGPRAQNKRCTLRYSLFEDYSFLPLTSEQIAILKLPAEIAWLEIYREPGDDEVEKLRDLTWFDELRAPSFPDDIKFLLVPDNPQWFREEVWGRLVRQIDDTLFECKLLNKPNQDFALKINDRVFVNIYQTAERVLAICLGPTAKYDVSGDATAQAIGLRNRGAERQEYGDLAGAIADYTRSLELDPAAAWSYCNRGLAYMYSDKFEEAMRDFNEAIRLVPGEGIFVYNRAALHATMGNFYDAVLDGQKACDLRPDYAPQFQERIKVWQSHL